MSDPPKVVTNYRARCFKESCVERHYRTYLQLCILNKSFLNALHPLVTTGQKVYLIPLTVATSYISLHMTQLVYVNPLMLATISIGFLASSGIQLVWYRMTMNLYKPARAVQRHFMRMGWAKKKPRPCWFPYRDLPKNGGTFGAWKQWGPPLFLKKITTGTMKVHFYIRPK